MYSSLSKKVQWILKPVSWWDHLGWCSHQGLQQELEKKGRYEKTWSQFFSSQEMDEVSWSWIKSSDEKE